MHDRIRGVVTNILGSDRFEIKVHDTGRFNEHNYKNGSCIRVAGISDPELYRKRTDQFDIEQLRNREVHCFIMTIDSQGNAVAVVQCVN